MKITGATTGKIIDYGLKDNQNMGGLAWPPPACDTIVTEPTVDFNREPADYDRIVTGDLGVVGREILLELLKKKGYDISEQHSDCGMLIFDPANRTPVRAEAAAAVRHRCWRSICCRSWKTESGRGFCLYRLVR